MVELSFKRKLTELYQIVRFPHLPCLQVGQKKDRYLPMEVCTIIPCQKRHLSEQQTANMIRSTARPAPERRQDIEYWVRYFFLPLFLWDNSCGVNLWKRCIDRFGTLRKVWPETGCRTWRGCVTAWLVHFVYNAFYAIYSLLNLKNYLWMTKSQPFVKQVCLLLKYIYTSSKKWILKNC